MDLFSYQCVCSVGHCVSYARKYLQRVSMDSLWITVSLKSEASPLGSGFSDSDSPWRSHEVKPGAVCRQNKRF